jgi:hypothetical protein
MARRSLPFTLVAVLLIRAIAAAQAHAPVVTMSVTLPDGRTQELTAPRKRTRHTDTQRRYGVRRPSHDSGQCTVESNRRDDLQERDNQLAYDGSRGNRAQERWPRHGFENESVLQGVRA